MKPTLSIERIHTAKKHTLTENETYLKVCEFCEESLETLNEMKRHLKSHSYKKANYKCEYCDFVCKHNLTMEMHMGKLHKDKLNVEFAELKLKTLKLRKLIFILVKLKKHTKRQPFYI